MIIRTKIGGFRASWVLRHRWEKGDSITNWTAAQLRKEWSLGIWAKLDKAVGQVKAGRTKQETIKATFTGTNLVNTWTIGLNLIVCKVWVNFAFSPTFGQH